MATLHHNAPMPVTLQQAFSPRTMAVRFGLNQLACTLIALILWLFRVDSSFWVGLVFSLLIGNCCWLLIDGGRALAARAAQALGGGVSPDWPGWPWMLPIVVVGTLAGYVLGHSAAKLLLGLPKPGLQLQMHGPVMVFSVLAALTIAYLFYARERMHQQQLQAAAAEKLAGDMQLKLLQSQLEPHMLFNTLANLRVLIGTDPAQAQAMLDQLVRFLRNTLASTRVERHALAAEFEALRDYLALMAVRMGPRLRSRLELPPALATLPVPPLLLQPLVENAIRHGLEPQVAGGSVTVSASRQGPWLQLRVHDDGAGLTVTAAAAAAAATPAATASGFGTQQVRQRLASVYGDAARFELRPAPGGGTEVLITLPVDDAAVP